MRRMDRGDVEKGTLMVESTSTLKVGETRQGWVGRGGIAAGGRGLLSLMRLLIGLRQQNPFAALILRR